MNLTPHAPESPSPAPLPPGLRPWSEVQASSSGGFQALIQAVRRGQQRALWWQGILWSLTALLVSTLALSLLHAIAPHVARACLWTLPFLGVGILLFFGVVLSRRRVGDADRTARWIGERLPDFSLNLLAAVELQKALVLQPDFSRELAVAFLARVDAQARRVRPSAVLDPTPTRRAAGALFASAALLLAVAAWGPAEFWSLLISRSQRGVAVAVGEREPITGDVQLTYSYPAYTGLSPRTLEGTNGEVSAPEGSEVRLKTRSDRPVQRAEAVVNGEPVPLTVASGRDLAGGFVVAKNGRYAFVFRDAAGNELARGPEVAITVETDAPPRVALLLPTAELEVDPKQEVVLKYDATDDYGLTALALVFKVGGQKEQRVPLTHDEGRHAQGTYRWSLDALNLQPGDRVAYYVEAQDNNAIRGVQKGVSRTQVLKVYSASEHRREAMTKVEALWERLLKQLADRMEGPDRNPNALVESILAQSSVDLQGTTLVTDLHGAVAQFRKERAPPMALVVGLTNIAEGLGRAVRQTGQSRRNYLHYRDRSPDFSMRLGQVVRQEIAELEKDALYLESLLDRQKLLELKELASQMAKDRRELTSLIERFQQTKDPAVQEQVLREAEVLKRRIQELMQRMAELTKGIRDEHLNLEALKQMADQKNPQAQMDKVQKLLREGKTEQALAELQKLATQIDDMQKSLDQSQKGQSKTNPELTQKFREFADQLKKAKQQQEKVAQDTKEIRDRYKAQLRERLKQRGQAIQEELKREVESLSKEYKGVSQQDLSNRADEPLQRTQEDLENLRNALDVKDYDLAAESAERAERTAEELARFGMEQARLDEFYQNPAAVGSHSRKVAQRLAEDSGRVREVAKKLQQLFPPPGSMMSEQDKGKLQKLAQQQHQLGEQGKGLQQKMEEINQLAPVFGEQGAQQMESISERMGEADQRLQGRDPGRGYGEQKAALDGMEQLEKQMQQGQSGGGGGGLPLPMLGSASGGSEQEGGEESSHEKIDIPDQDAFQAPKEFRKDLLDAMKQGTPEKYKDQVKQYYEELVK